MSELTKELLQMIVDAKITDIAPRHLRMMAAELLEARAKILDLDGEIRYLAEGNEDAKWR